MWERVDFQGHEAPAKTPMVLGDVRMPGQRRKDFRGGSLPGK